MKALALIIMFIALYLLYRIAFPKQPGTKQGNDSPRKREIDTSEVVVKSRFVRPDHSQSQPTRTTIEKTEYQEKNTNIFAAGNEKKDAVIPPGKLDEVFEDFNPDDLEIPPDEDDRQEATDEPDWEEEAEDLWQPSGRETGIADGMSIEEMTEAVAAIDNPADEKAGLLFRVEKTDMFEQLVSGDEGKSARIKAIIDRYVQTVFAETASNVSGTDYRDFNMTDFLAKNINI